MTEGVRIQLAHKPQILVVDDHRETAEFIQELLSQAALESSVCCSFNESLNLIRSNPYDVIVTDLRLGSFLGTDLIEHTKKLPEPPAVILITGFGDMDTAVEAIHNGAFDYLSKPNNLFDIQNELIAVVRRALKHRSAHVPASSEEEPAVEIDWRSKNMVGRSSAMIKIYRAIAKAALTRENVLITGESGTGKELVARAIHEKSPWVRSPFITVNCCALTETLLESELFGHIRGSFTGASQNKKGLFEEANGGTLFLDEIGDVTPPLQVKLLRAIQEGEIKPVGSTETRKVDVRVIAATHRDLQRHVQDNFFREDLYYRLKVILIEMPPLRDRKEDLPELIQYFIRRSAKKTGKVVESISDEAIELLLEYRWPGNIRELENAVGRAVAMSNSSVLFPEDLPDEIFAPVPSPEAATNKTISRLQVVRSASSTDKIDPQATSLEDLEKQHIARVLESVHYNKSKAAEILGIDRVTLYRKAFKYGILIKSSDLTNPSN